MEKVLAKKRLRLKGGLSSVVMYLVRWQKGADSDSWENHEFMLKFAKEKLAEFSQWLVQSGLQNQYNIAKLEAKSSPKLSSQFVSIPHEDKLHFKFYYKAVRPKSSVAKSKSQSGSPNGSNPGDSSVTSLVTKKKVITKFSDSLNNKTDQPQSSTQKNPRTSDLLNHRPSLLQNFKNKHYNVKTVAKYRRSSASSGSSDSGNLYSLASTESRNGNGSSSGNRKSHPTYTFKKATRLSISCDQPLTTVQPKGVSTPESDDVEISFKVPVSTYPGW